MEFSPLCFLMRVHGTLVQNYLNLVEAYLIHREHNDLVQNCLATLDALEQSIASFQEHSRSNTVSIEWLSQQQKTIHDLAKMQQYYRSVYDRLIVEHAIIRFNTPCFLLWFFKIHQTLGALGKLSEKFQALKHQIYHLDKVMQRQPKKVEMIRVGC